MLIRKRQWFEPITWPLMCEFYALPIVLLHEFSPFNPFALVHLVVLFQEVRPLVFFNWKRKLFGTAHLKWTPVMTDNGKYNNNNYSTSSRNIISIYMNSMKFNMNQFQCGKYINAQNKINFIQLISISFAFYILNKNSTACVTLYFRT